MKEACLYFLLFMVFISCSGDRRSNAPQDPVVVASESNEYKVFSKSRGSDDLVEKLYEEKLKNTPALKDFKDALEDAQRFNDSTKYFYDYDAKSVSYYQAAEGHISAIQDSMVKEKVRRIVDVSHDRYEIFTSHHKMLLNQLESNNEKVADLHAAVKVLITLSDIQNFQKKNFPSARPIQNAIDKQKEVIRRADSIILKTAGK